MGTFAVDVFYRDRDCLGYPCASVIHHPEENAITPAAPRSGIRRLKDCVHLLPGQEAEHGPVEAFWGTARARWIDPSELGSMVAA